VSPLGILGRALRAGSPLHQDEDKTLNRASR
jgi:hypothetical protein